MPLSCWLSCSLAPSSSATESGITHPAPAAKGTDPALTTGHQPVQALGQEMAKVLIALMAGEQPGPLILPARLLVRASAP